MSLETWLAERRLRSHKTTKDEITALFDVAQRDLSDAAVQGLSADRRFLIAYEAALALATIPLYAAGYETHGHGHHWLTFQALAQVMGAEFEAIADYFEICRTKRNVGTYDRGGQISETEAEELIEEVKGFQRSVLDWLERHSPELV